MSLCITGATRLDAKIPRIYLSCPQSLSRLPLTCTIKDKTPKVDIHLILPSQYFFPKGIESSGGVRPARHGCIDDNEFTNSIEECIWVGEGKQRNPGVVAESTYDPPACSPCPHKRPDMRIGLRIRVTWRRCPPHPVAPRSRTRLRSQALVLEMGIVSPRWMGRTWTSALEEGSGGRCYVIVDIRWADVRLHASLPIVRSRPRQPAKRMVRLVQPGCATSRRCCSLDFHRNLIGSLASLFLAPLVALPALAAQAPGPPSSTGGEVRRPADPLYIILSSPADLDALLEKILYPDLEIRRVVPPVKGAKSDAQDGLIATSLGVVQSVYLRGRIAEDYAILKVELAIAIMSDDTTWVPIRLDDQKLAGAREGNRELSLRRNGQSQWEVELTGRGGHRIEVDLRAQVTAKPAPRPSRWRSPWPPRLPWTSRSPTASRTSSSGRMRSSGRSNPRAARERS